MNTYIGLKSLLLLMLRLSLSLLLCKHRSGNGTLRALLQIVTDGEQKYRKTYLSPKLTKSLFCFVNETIKCG